MMEMTYAVRVKYTNPENTIILSRHGNVETLILQGIYFRVFTSQESDKKSVSLPFCVHNFRYSAIFSQSDELLAIMKNENYRVFGDSW